MLELQSLIIVVVIFSLLVITLTTKSGIEVTVKGFNSNRKRIDLIYVFLIFFYWAIAVGVKDSADLFNYRWAYDCQLSHGKEPLFDVIQFYLHQKGVSFDTFKFFWVSTISILLYTGIKKYCISPNKVVALALISILLGFITQMRSALVGGIFINAFPLILSGKKREKILYCFLILLASQFHIVGYCFLVFLIINRKESMTFKKVYYFIVAIITFIALFSSSFASSYIGNVIRFLSEDGANSSRVVNYFSGETSHFRYAFFLICKHLFFFFLTNKACDIQINETVVSLEECQRFRMIREANTLMLMFLPITMLSASFERIFNYFALIQYAMAFNIGKCYITFFEKISWKSILQPVMVFGTLFITFVELYFSSSDVVRMLNSIKWNF